ncbi:uncharacterized protein LOC62_06G008606 [Vanrija pseudolonga]|uniref:Uncharacterized protein n=1 Tax=Vanrija pseudolonga TaxID=143232 RepID=A0AAF1BQQ5_9TREE|nr:hypothetical protein LOC62_06G008606 [Vanrija pseudolonga]
MPALLTASQSRWALHAFIAILSVAAIASSAPRTNGVGDMLHGSRGREGTHHSGSGGDEDEEDYSGDVRGVIVLVGLTGLAGVLLLRGVDALVPRPWRYYLDRIEFNFAAMMWILWTSATMAFSAVIVNDGVCASSLSVVRLPACPLLTFDLAVLHLLSVSSLALLLVILSSICKPGYEMSHSLLSESDSESGSPKGGGLVLWDLALAPIPEPAAGPSSALRSTYGTVEAVEAAAAAPDFSPPPAPRDKFAEGRLWSYVPLVVCSLGVVVCAAILAGMAGSSVGGSVFIIVTGVISTIFGITCLAVHFTKPSDPSQLSWNDDESLSFLRTHDRAIEVAFATLLFLLWPLAAVVYTMFPATANRPCVNPEARTGPGDSLDPGSLHGYTGTLCMLSAAAITMAWFASWILFARVLGLMFPMPSVGWQRAAAARRVEEAGEEGRGLLEAAEPAVPAPRPQVKYGRIVAGEAFELGDEED